ncbi:hypothetical protein EWS82_13270, partial [Staphylococcus xylosus]|nr:hypothetical protein [Staphylococcus xylosus]
MVPLEFSCELNFDSRIAVSFLVADITASLLPGACAGGSTIPRGGHVCAVADAREAPTAIAAKPRWRYFISK